VKTKFLLWERTENAGFDGVNLTFRAVMSGCEENKSFSRYTPSGEIKLCVTNPEIVDNFQVGQHYYVTFQVAEPPQPEQNVVELVLPIPNTIEA
jgi:hypothetical protein